jgi:hypothetical protein
MMGQGFGDEIGRALARFIVFVCIVCCAIGYGMSFVVSWLIHHVAIHWK